MDIQPPKQINVTKARAIELAMKYRRGNEPLTETVQRLLERYDATQPAKAAPQADPAPQPADAST